MVTIALTVDISDSAIKALKIPATLRAEQAGGRQRAYGNLALQIFQRRGVDEDKIQPTYKAATRMVPAASATGSVREGCFNSSAT